MASPLHTDFLRISPSQNVENFIFTLALPSGVWLMALLGSLNHTLSGMVREWQAGVWITRGGTVGRVGGAVGDASFSQR